MPFWYALCLLLLIAETYARRHSTQVHFIHAAAIIWTFTIIYLAIWLVPVNSRFTRLASDSTFPGWRDDHIRRDTLHRRRIIMLDRQ